MQDPIRRLAHWLARLLAPSPHTLDPYPHSSSPSVTAPVPPPTALPRLRSPYGREPLVIDAGASPLVRPYLAAHERESARHRRRIALVLAADFGIDLDLHVVGMPGVAF
ncbi:hypothetical protein OG890_18065 [Streptomyces anulatus]|uniref:hypothetical protein n=1 Tax=Streptomyces anulatus TaxID=1892 RepID=UPI00225C1A5D|nr:hypothetical protein [Streptomyces anulatus]MCX4485834.1 hypothetical protein [Streptomyces anulatus]